LWVKAIAGQLTHNGGDNCGGVRTAPVDGDQRLLIAFVGGKPRVVLYQPVALGAGPDEAWATQTPAGGTTRFDRVVELGKAASVALKGDRDFTVEAAIPLKALGLSPRAGLRLRGDWGILTSDDGRQVKTRAYWSNLGATGTADEPTEARLEPHHWGRIVFAVDPARRFRGPELLHEKPGDSGAIEGVLDELGEQ